MTHPPRAVLDADVIYSRVLYELIGRVALRLRVVDLVWSYELMSEAKRSLIDRKGLSGEIAQLGRPPSAKLSQRSHTD